MNWVPPEEYETYDLIGGGVVDLGRGRVVIGLTSGTAPHMARIRDLPRMPDDWFTVSPMNLHSVKILLSEGKIPVEVERDCYRAAWLKGKAL